MLGTTPSPAAAASILSAPTHQSTTSLALSSFTRADQLSSVRDFSAESLARAANVIIRPRASEGNPHAIQTVRTSNSLGGWGRCSAVSHFGMI